MIVLLLGCTVEQGIFRFNTYGYNQESVLSDGWEVQIEQAHSFLSQIELYDVVTKEVQYQSDGSWLVNWLDGEEMLMEQIVPRTRWGVSLLFGQTDERPMTVGAIEESIQPTLWNEEAGMWIAGTAQQGDQQLSFEWALDLPVILSQCTDADGVEGIDLRSTSNDVVLGWDLSHTFLTSLEFGAQQMAFQAIADSDADGDAVITTEELATVSIESAGYNTDERTVASLESFVAMSLIQGLQISDTNQCVIWVQ